MKSITFFIASAVLCFVSAPTFAQDYAPFTGAHAEIITGYDVVDAKGVKSADGLLYGLNAGYDFALSGLILGIEGEISDSTTRLHVAGGKSETDRDLYVGGRIGVPLGSKALAYMKAGYSNARMEYEASDGEGGLIRGGDNGDGLRLGAGLEYRIAEKLFLKGEYRYSDYEAGVSRHQLVTGIGLRF
ncbi:Opacity protein antigens-like protein [Sphingobium yanoikuyae]|uniref:Opacity protein antigens-like protein n=1 Tax=Sphingobium yanoikuyae TaxID=13690 RepID=A0A084ENX8_SPHYA|nr:porin family protein [Sphingobium yanoikuyae]KEZ19670.1 Opacity protein antigens-like protein [Sphingobium yanoikuyae]